MAFFSRERDNLKSLLFISFYISQKVIDDVSIKHSEYVRLWKELSPEHELISVVEFTKLEKDFLENIQWNVNISETTFYLFEYELYIYICYQNNYIYIPNTLNFLHGIHFGVYNLYRITRIYIPQLYIQHGKTKFISSLIPNCCIYNNNKQLPNKSKKRKYEAIVKKTSTCSNEDLLVKSLHPGGPYNPYPPYIY